MIIGIYCPTCCKKYIKPVTEDWTTFVAKMAFHFYDTHGLKLEHYLKSLHIG